MIRIKGLAKQAGTSLMEPFGLASSAVEGFVKTYKDDIINGFGVISDFMNRSIRNGISAFIDFGIPAITSFIGVANQIGDAFATVFNFIGGTNTFKSTISAIEEISNTLITFVGNFKQIFISGVTGSISSILNFTFRSLAKFSEFIGDQLATIAFAVGQDEFGQNITDAFTEQSASLRELGKDLAEPFKIAMQEADRQMSENIESQADKNLKNQMAFKGIVIDFETALEEAGRSVGSSVKRGGEEAGRLIRTSDRASGLAITGSQEEFRQRAKNDQLSIDIDRRNLKANEKTSKVLSKAGIF